MNTTFIRQTIKSVLHYNSIVVSDWKTLIIMIILSKIYVVPVLITRETVKRP